MVEKEPVQNITASLRARLKMEAQERSVILQYFAVEEIN